MDMNQQIFDGKSFSDLLKDIYDNSMHKKKQINKLTEELSNFVKRVSDVAVISPIIKEYLDVGVKNDDHLIKIAAIVQRAMQRGSDEASSLILTDAEKKQLLVEVEKMQDSEDKGSEDKDVKQ